jgi:hypothetical protein
MRGSKRLFAYIRQSAYIVFLIAACSINVLQAAEKIPIIIKENIPGAPQLLGIPFPINKLNSTDEIRVLNQKGVEIPSQITIVNTWAPASESVKWIWVFFFSEKESNYTLEYGTDFKRTVFPGQRVLVENNVRPAGSVKVNTGPLKFTINRNGAGFMDKVELDTKGDGFDKEDLIAESEKGRGTFMDLLDESGVDLSNAEIVNTYVEKGSGPLHAIIRIEGNYKYSRPDNNISPFVIRIHAYAGKSYIRVLHSLVYTGEPDMHVKPEGQYAAIATQNKVIIDQEKLKDAPGWMLPNDQIKNAGFLIKYNLSGERKFQTGYFDGSWKDPGTEKILSSVLKGSENISILQNGPELIQNDVDPDFKSEITISGQDKLEKARMPGWTSIRDKKWGIGIGIKNFFEEYPKEIAINGVDSSLFGYIYSPNVKPLSFARASGKVDSEMIANFAQGLAKTTELVYQFFKVETTDAEIHSNFKYFLEPPVSHVPPQWYADSKVYGSFAPKDNSKGDLERGLDYKFAWMKYNQEQEPWYGMLNYGDFQTYYRNNTWNTWTNNEPGNDYMWWLEFMRTGNRDYYLTAWSASQHTMDVDNIHWPNFPNYKGNTNNSVDFFNSGINETTGSPYVGMGRRHAAQQYTSLLSAHVWVSGWLASYYLAGNHRGLDIAEQTGDFYLRREFGDHDFRGRRLYLSIWNLIEIYDANKKQKYWDELNTRVSALLELQKESDQAGSLVIERYGYSQVYLSQGLYKYYQLTSDQKVKNALIMHANWQLKNPSLNHKMESFMASIPSLLIGYEFTKDKSYLNEASERAKFLHTDPLPVNINSFKSKIEFAQALDKTSNMPPDTESMRGEAIWKATNGLRVFGWTHIYSIPYLIYWLNNKP